jgi:hypothetical protein
MRIFLTAARFSLPTPAPDDRSEWNAGQFSRVGAPTRSLNSAGPYLRVAHTLRLLTNRESAGFCLRVEETLPPFRFSVRRQSLSDRLYDSSSSPF